MKSKEGPRCLRPGDIVSLVSSGGGGWGDPLRRRPEAVLEDYLNGIISAAKAQEEYGVVINGNVVDEEATIALRAQMRR